MYSSHIRNRGLVLPLFTNEISSGKRFSFFWTFGVFRLEMVLWICPFQSNDNPTSVPGAASSFRRLAHPRSKAEQTESPGSHYRSVIDRPMVPPLDFQPARSTRRFQSIFKLSKKAINALTH